MISAEPEYNEVPSECNLEQVNHSYCLAHECGPFYADRCGCDDCPHCNGDYPLVAFEEDGSLARNSDGSIIGHGR